MKILEGFRGEINSLQIVKNGEYLLCAGKDKTIRLYHLQTESKTEVKNDKKKKEKKSNEVKNWHLWKTIGELELSLIETKLENIICESTYIKRALE